MNLRLTESGACPPDRIGICEARSLQRSETCQLHILITDAGHTPYEGPDEESVENGRNDGGSALRKATQKEAARSHPPQSHLSLPTQENEIIINSAHWKIQLKTTKQ